VSMSGDASTLQLGLGPVLYLWEGATWRDFYFRIADEAPIEVVTLGEVVCSKRQHFLDPHFAAVVERLQRGGKKVVLASLAMVTLEREAQLTRRLCSRSELWVEANDLSALGLLAGRPHAVGPFVNVYNVPTLRLLAARGAQSVCLPPELTGPAVAEIAGALPATAIEVFAFGRVPLAISARCAHARAKGLTKDHCQFVCGDDPDGLPVATLDHQAFLALNGVQTMSATCQALLHEIAGLAEAGVRRLRLSPQRCDMVAVARLFAAVRDRELSPDEGMDRLAAIYPGVAFSNGFHHGAPGAALVRRPAEREAVS
jgi:O2-independent ubiquinone biosynthesis protein UbiV